MLDLHFVQAGSHDLAAGIRTGDFDLAFVALTDHLGAVDRAELGQQDLVAVAAPGHSLAATPGAVRWDDLRELDFIDFHPAWSIRTLVDEIDQAHDLRRRSRFTVNEVHTLLELVHRNLGAAIVPRHVSAKPQASGLVVRPLPSTAPRWVVSTITGAKSAPAARPLLELLHVSP